MMEQPLSSKKCRECEKDILVAEYSPHPLEKDATGMAASLWDDGKEKFVGWICNDCAWQRAMKTGDGPKGTICGPMLDFIYD